ncbi:MAG: hypothetical protein KF754_11640 [Planctomycetes bacterium]|nr:hypothetical protein [Planctomycetota bacterium]
MGDLGKPARIIALALMLAAPLWAQLPPGGQLPDGVQAPPASADKESFIIQPKNLPTGAKDQTIRLVCNTASGFNTSSSRPPELKFSAGAALKPGSFMLLNANEAECRVDIADDAFGTVNVSLELYSVNGSAVFSTLNATLGITGPVSVSGSQAKVGAESIELVRVNHSAAQKAGALLIFGRIAGTVSVTAPTGTLFSKAPVASASAGTINSPVLSSNNTVFTFSIGNASLDDVTVRIGDIEYNTQLFGLAGGTQGVLACEITGAALSNQSALVVNAHTARTTVAGKNDVAAPAAGSGSQSGGGTTTPGTPTTPAGSVRTQPSSSGRGLEDSPRPARNRQNQNQGGSGGAGAVTPRPATSDGPRPVAAPPAQPLQPGNQGGVAPQPQPAPAGAAPVAGGAASGNRNASDGSMKPQAGEKPPAPGTVSGNRPDIREVAGVLNISPGLYFCDKDFNPLGAVVLDKTVSGEAGGRVWIVLKRDKDKDPTRVETVTVKLKVSGVVRELVLTETGKDTGEFRCGKEGVLLLSGENPDSNTVATPDEPAKIRLPR